MEGEHIVSGTSDAELVKVPVLESGVDGGHNVPVPEDVHEGIGLTGRAAECAGMEERDGVVLAGYGGQWRRGSERSSESIDAKGRAEETRTMASVSVSLVEEYGGILESTGWTGTDPVSVGGGIAEVVAIGIALETTVDDIVLALVATGESDMEVSLAGIHSGGHVRDDEILFKCDQELRRLV